MSKSNKRGVFLESAVELNISCTAGNRNRAYKLAKNINREYPGCRVQLSCSDRNKIVIDTTCFRKDYRPSRAPHTQEANVTDKVARQIQRAKNHGIMDGTRRRRR